MNYSAKGLRGVFPKYFPTDDLASKYERKPEKIGNRVYANRMGNSDEASGEGYKFRGLGFIQLTGKDNFKNFSNDTGIDILTDPDSFRSDLSICIKTAVWFWNKNNLNKYADSGDFVGLTKRINGGTIGLEERQRNYNKLMS
jgi:putative chitinase